MTLPRRADPNSSCETAIYRSLAGITPRKLRFLEPLEIQKHVFLTASAGRSFLGLVEHLSRNGLKPNTIDILGRSVSLVKRWGSMSVTCYVRLVGIAHDKAILTVGVERPLLSRLVVERAWYTQVLQEVLARVDDALEQR